jgi:CubicO group peptidase (beta-lactamase class C family)
MCVVPTEPTMGIDTVLRKPIEAGLIPGVVARAADDPQPMTPDSVFRIASMTKAITGTAAMQLVEGGLSASTSQWTKYCRWSRT